MTLSPSPNRSSPAVYIHELRHRYGANAPVLHIPELKIFPGERVFIYGPSGSGKTTLLGLLSGILETQSGTIEVLGEKISAMSSAERDDFRGDHLGYIFQMFNLIPYLSVKDNIFLSCDLNPVKRQRLKEGKEIAIKNIAESLGISSLLDRKVTELSVGQQQRVAVARALIGAPSLIIADEPTSALDYDHREKFLHLLFSECKKTDATVIFVSHDHQLESLFDRRISLKEINKI